MNQKVLFFLKMSSLCVLLLIQRGVCLAAYTDLPNMVNNRVASAMAGQMASRGVGASSLGSSFSASLQAGAFVSLVDAVARRALSTFLECPVQSDWDIIQISSSTIARSVASGVVSTCLKHNGIEVNPVIYAGMYAVADTLITASINIQMHGGQDIQAYRWRLLSESLFSQSLFALTFSFAGYTAEYLVSRFGSKGNFITQMVLMYGSAMAYVTYIEIRIAIAELRTLG